MQQSIDKTEESQAAKSYVTVMSADSGMIWGRFEYYRRVFCAVPSLSVAVKPCSHSALAPASPSGLLTKEHKTSGYIGKAFSQSLSYQQKVSMEVRLSPSALPALEWALNLGHDTVACIQNTQDNEQRCCFAA